ncbi:MAG: hypothetical protein IPM48_02740 [Saprospiraceae bacterium]|nr:hypothetical protein [Saprospiraceae bacterium]
MEAWQLDFEYLRIRHFIKDKFGKKELPDLNAILLLIGIQELGRTSTSKFTKEEKTDLLHIASCRLLSQEGYYEFEGLDQDGWPHYIQLKPFTLKGVKEQENFLKEMVIRYFQTEYSSLI